MVGVKERKGEGGGSDPAEGWRITTTVRANVGIL